MAEQHPINGLMGTSMEKIRELVDVNTIIGDPITSPESFPFRKSASALSQAVQTCPQKLPRKYLQAEAAQASR